MATRVISEATREKLRVNCAKARAARVAKREARVAAGEPATSPETHQKLCANLAKARAARTCYVKADVLDEPNDFGDEEDVDGEPE